MGKILAKVFSNKISKNLFLLYFLNLSDWLSTVYLLNTGKFMEANPFMLPFMNSALTSFLAKGILPLALVLFINYRANYATAKQVKLANRVVGVGITIYTLINLMHLFNFWFMIFMM